MNRSISELIEIIDNRIKKADKELLIWTERYAEGKFENGKEYDAEQYAMVKHQIKVAVERLSINYDLMEVLNDKFTESGNKNKCDD